VTELYTIGEAYDMPSEPVDAMDVEAVHEAVSRAAARARSGEGPTFLEFRTYRYRGHSMSDPQKYRSKEEVETYKDRDPIENVKARILENRIATQADLDAIDAKIKVQVQESVDFAEASPFPTADEAYKDVYVQEDYPFVAE
jgi:pyruvate dehydrogenase E1 component alpha subunit